MTSIPLPIVLRSESRLAGKAVLCINDASELFEVFADWQASLAKISTLEAALNTADEAFVEMDTVLAAALECGLTTFSINDMRIALRGHPVRAVMLAAIAKAKEAT